MPVASEGSKGAWSRQVTRLASARRKQVTREDGVPAACAGKVTEQGAAWLPLAPTCPRAVPLRSTPPSGKESSEASKAVPSLGLTLAATGINTGAKGSSTLV